MKIKGKVWKFGPDINTDDIIPAPRLVSTDPKELAKYCFEYDRPDFAKNVKKGDIIVAEKNFGCGSSREHAPIAIKGAEVSCVIAKSFARIFYRNSFNMGLLILESEEAVDGTSEGDTLSVDAATGKIKNLTTKKEYMARPIPEFMRNLVADGGLMASIKKRGVV